MLFPRPRRFPVLRLVAVLAAGWASLLSCATLPPARDVQRWSGVLPTLTAESIYISANPAASWGLVRTVSAAAGQQEIEGIDAVIDRLERLHACIHLGSPENPQAPPRFALIALGRLSPGPVARRLGLDSSWERVMLDPPPGADAGSSHWSHRTYWQRDSLQIAAPQRGVLLLSANRGIETMLMRLQAPVEQSLEARAAILARDADLFLYFPDPLALASARAQAELSAGGGGAAGGQDTAEMLKRLPLREAWIGAQRRDSDYEIEAVFLLAEAENTRSMELLLRLLLTLWMRNARVENAVEKLKGVVIQSDSQSARIGSLYLSEQEIAGFAEGLLPVSMGAGGRR